VGQVAHGAAFLEPNHHASNEKKKWKSLFSICLIRVVGMRGARFLLSMIL
jgi:hypothetical protein